MKQTPVRPAVPRFTVFLAFLTLALAPFVSLSQVMKTPSLVIRESSGLDNKVIQVAGTVSEMSRYNTYRGRITHFQLIDGVGAYVNVLTADEPSCLQSGNQVVVVGEFTREAYLNLGDGGTVHMSNIISSGHIRLYEGGLADILQQLIK